jgi:hypothetical protein
MVFLLGWVAVKRGVDLNEARIALIAKQEQPNGGQMASNEKPEAEGPVVGPRRTYSYTVRVPERVEDSVKEEGIRRQLAEARKSTAELSEMLAAVQKSEMELIEVLATAEKTAAGKQGERVNAIIAAHETNSQKLAEARGKEKELRQKLERVQKISQDLGKKLAAIEESFPLRAPASGNEEKASTQKKDKGKPEG